MSELFQILTRTCVDGEPVECRYLPPGLVREVAPRVVMHLHADRIIDGCRERYQPNITVFAHGKPAASDDGFCFDISRQAGIKLCVRGMQVNAEGKPVRFLVELYRRAKGRHLHVVA